MAEGVGSVAVVVMADEVVGGVGATVVVVVAPSQLSTWFQDKCLGLEGRDELNTFELVCPAN